MRENDTFYARAKRPTFASSKKELYGRIENDWYVVSEFCETVEFLSSKPN